MTRERTATRPPLRWALIVGLTCLACLTCLLRGAPAHAEGCPNEARRAEQQSTYLAECRGFELVSPVNKYDEEVEVPRQADHEVGFQAAAGAAGVAYTLTGGIPGSGSAGLYTSALGRRETGGGGWGTTPLNPENRFGTLPGVGGRNAGTFWYFSPELTCGVEATTLGLSENPGESSPKLAPGEEPSEKIENLYVWDAAVNTYTLVTSVRPQSPDGSTETEEGYVVDGANDECRHVIYEAVLPGYNLSGAPAGSLYEWTQGGSPRVASVLPDGKPASTVVATDGGSRESTLNQLSEEGGRTRVVFTAQSEHEQGSFKPATAVFLRENGESTVEVSATTTSTADKGARYQASSANGSEVLFTANYGLTSETSSGSEAPPVCENEGQPGSGAHYGPGCDLYLYDVAAKRLTDLTVDTEAATGDKKGAGVESVLGTSPDDSVVYFSASGRLVKGVGNTQPENEASEGTTPYGVAKTTPEANVYAYHDGEITYVATIGQIEVGGGGAPPEEVDALAGVLGNKFLESRVTSDGSRLLIATRSQLTSYDNAQPGGEREWEDYEYELGSVPGGIRCVSCNPAGTAPDTSQAPKSAFFPGGDYNENRNGLIPRSLAEDGEVYFQTAQPLLAQAVNDEKGASTVNAYEWRPSGVAGCEQSAGCLSLLDSGTSAFPTYFEDASASGEDVYVTTHAQLAPQDEDGLRDIYDVRVDGGFARPAEPGSCSGNLEACQPAGASLSGASHASESSAGGGNLTNPAPVAQKPGISVPSQGVKASVSRKVKATKVSLSISAPSAGKLTASGSGFKTLKKSVARAAVYKITVSLTAHEKKLLRRRHKLKLKLTIAFASASGTSSRTAASITFT